MVYHHSPAMTRESSSSSHFSTITNIGAKENKIHEEFLDIFHTVSYSLSRKELNNFNLLAW